MAVESLVSKRGQTTRGTIQDVMGRAQGGFESDVASRQGAAQMAQQQRSGLLEEYGLARQEQQDVLAQQQTGRGTVGERQLSRVRDSVIADVKGGLKTEDLARKYGGQMDDWELINLYNENSPYGTMTEAPQTFKDWTSKKDDENKVETAEKTAEYITQIDTYTSKEEALRDFEIYKSVMEAQGVDVEKIRQAIEDKFPETANDVSGGISKFLQELLKTRTYG